jgi:CRP/FNR family transcriptional regulator, cyclic AMP receptor protein
MTETPAARGRKLLEQCSLFASMEEHSRRELVALAHPRRYDAGEPICRLGDVGLSMMAVASGTVRISLPMAKGKEIILADLPTGELFGEIAMLDGRPRSADATALTKCELLVLERRHVIPFLEQNPSVCLKLMEMLCARIRHSDERMADIAFFDLPTRLAKVLLNYPAKTRDDTRLSLSQTELAEMAGGTRENVNRCLRDWQRRGIVESKGGWTIILKAEELRRLATGNPIETGAL